MDTPSSLAGRITAAVVSQFAEANGITESHLTTAPHELTPVETVRACRALGAGVVFP